MLIDGPHLTPTSLGLLVLLETMRKMATRIITVNPATIMVKKMSMTRFSTILVVMLVKYLTTVVGEIAVTVDIMVAVVA